jgi:1-acyl-sn-glycerol-3-phosphate acyltransferase
MIRKLLYLFLNLFLRIFTRVETKGENNVPEKGAAIFAINHIGRLDMVLAFISIKRWDATGWAAEKYQTWPLFGWLIKNLQGVWVNRQNPGVAAIKEAKKYLNAGWLFGVAPEGTRSETRTLQEGKPGGAYLASVTGVPVIPVGVTFPIDTFYQAIKLKKPKMTIAFGEPFYIPKLDKKKKQVQLDKHTDEIMCQIAKLLPVEYQGIYANHPRLLELISSNE